MKVLVTVAEIQNKIGWSVIYHDGALMLDTIFFVCFLQHGSKGRGQWEPRASSAAPRTLSAPKKWHEKQTIIVAAHNNKCGSSQVAHNNFS